LILAVLAEGGGAAGGEHLAAAGLLGLECRQLATRKRNHYLPESYLKAWADKHGQVAVRRRRQPDVFCATTRKVAVEADLYAVPTGAGLDDALEVALSEVEELLPGCLELLREGPTPRKGSEERNDISDLLALQIVRTCEYVHRWMFPLDAAAYTGQRPISLDGAELAQLSLRPVRPALRFNTAPMLERDATGRLVPTGHEVLPTFVPYGDDAG